MIELKRNREIYDYLFQKLESSKKSIKIAIAWFTDPDLAELLLRKKNNGIEIKIITLNDSINSNLTRRKSFGTDLMYYVEEDVEALMHHKFCIIDDIAVITGSYNWTVKARRKNRENIVYTDDSRLVENFGNEFSDLLNHIVNQHHAQPPKPISQETPEDFELLKLEESYNAEIYRRIKEIEYLNKKLPKSEKIDIELVYNYISRHTPVIAAKQLANSGDENNPQTGLQKLFFTNKLYLSFEESIIRKEYSQLFDQKTKDAAKRKLTKLNFFENEIYLHLIDFYEV